MCAEKFDYIFFPVWKSRNRRENHAGVRSCKLDQSYILLQNVFVLSQIYGEREAFLAKRSGILAPKAILCKTVEGETVLI